jgi:hypothetical protein
MTAGPLDVFNGILILNNPVDGPYYWNGDITTRMRRLPGWAAGTKPMRCGRSRTT